MLVPCSLPPFLLESCAYQLAPPSLVRVPLGTHYPSHQSLDWLSLAQLFVPSGVCGFSFPSDPRLPKGRGRQRFLETAESPVGCALFLVSSAGSGLARELPVQTVRICVSSHLSNYHTPANCGVFTLPTLINIDDEGKSLGLPGDVGEGVPSSVLQAMLSPISGPGGPQK